MDTASGPIIPEFPVECPKCGAPMRLIDPFEEGRSDYEAFWGCTEYSNNNCRGTRQVDLRTHLPIYTQEETDDMMLQRIRDERIPDPGAQI